MGHRIKVTGYIDTADLHEDDLDPDHPSGLSLAGYEALPGWEIGTLSGITLKVED